MIDLNVCSQEGDATGRSWPTVAVAGTGKFDPTGPLAQRLTKRREGISFLGAHQRPALISRGTPETNAAGNPSLSILLMLPAGR